MSEKEREPNVEREAPAPAARGQREAIKAAREQRGEQDFERSIPDPDRLERT